MPLKCDVGLLALECGCLHYVLWHAKPCSFADISNSSVDVMRRGWVVGFSFQFYILYTLCNESGLRTVKKVGVVRDAKKWLPEINPPKRKFVEGRVLLSQILNRFVIRFLGCLLFFSFLFFVEERAQPSASLPLSLSQSNRYPRLHQIRVNHLSNE